MERFFNNSSKILLTVLMIVVTVLVFSSNSSVLGHYNNYDKNGYNTSKNNKNLSFSISPASKTLKVGEKATLCANDFLKAYGYNNKNVEVVKAYASGMIIVEAKKAGTTNISVYSRDGKKATCVITVQENNKNNNNNDKGKKFSINPASKTLKVGEKATFFASDSIKSYNNNNKNAVNTIVYSNGKITVEAKKAGTSKITVYSKDGKSATCTITVQGNSNNKGSNYNTNSYNTNKVNNYNTNKGSNYNTNKTSNTTTQTKTTQINTNTSGTVKQARFTAYWPSNSGVEGGYYDCMGYRLNPANKTCAAPSNLKYGTKLIINGTGIRSIDGQVYTVTDRGGAIYIQNDGVYRIDILMSSASECNNFGVRYGTITILQ